jgi:hypothetical protein
MIYLRADGVPPASDAVLNQQFEMDRTICQGDMQKAKRIRRIDYRRRDTRRFRGCQSQRSGIPSRARLHG